MAKNKIKISESKLKDIISQTLNENYFGIKNPADDYVIDKNVLKQKCAEFRQKCEEFQSVLSAMELYLDGDDESIESPTHVSGVAMDAYLKSVWSQDLSDKYLAEDLKAMSKHVRNTKYEVETLIEFAQDFER